MLAAVFQGRNDLRLERRPPPIAAPGEIVVRVRSCGVCGSDLRSWARGPSERYTVPVVLGHEFVGLVDHVGDGVEIPIGTRVTAAPAIPCGRCEACGRGSDNLCAELLDFGVNIDGGFAEYLRIPARSVDAGAVVSVPPSLPDAAAILGEPIGCCLRGQRLGNVAPGCSVLVIGDGPIGLAHVVVARTLGASRVLCVGHNPGRLATIARAGAETVEARDDADVASLVRSALAGPADVVIAAAPDPRAVELGVACVRDGGSVVAFGGLAGDPTISLDGNRIHYGEVTIVGSFNCTTQEFRAAIDLAGRVDHGLFEATSFPLERINDAFAAAAQRSVFKAVITMEQST
jgi:threonine dehydrogenase-like Zn-dependent dehydrogenase